MTKYSNINITNAADTIMTPGLSDLGIIYYGGGQSVKSTRSIKVILL